MVHVSSLHKCNTICFQSCSFFPAIFSAGQQTCLVAWTTDVHATRQVCHPAKKCLEKKLHDIKKCWLHLFKPETCTYISLAAIYGLTAITKMLVAGWKYARFLCYSMGARWFLRFLGPKLELPSMSAYSPYLRCLWIQLTVLSCTDRHTVGSILQSGAFNALELMSETGVAYRHRQCGQSIWRKPVAVM